MDTVRKSVEVLDVLLRTMTETVLSYHPDVRSTSSTVEGLIQGTACFPGGAGLWRGRPNGGSLPVYFPESPLMFVGHNFDSERGYEISLMRGGEGEGVFWTRLLRMLESGDCEPAKCFFTNALMGLKPGKAEGEMPSVPGYKEECQRYLQRQVEIVKPCAIVALGSRAIRYVSKLNGRHVAIRHPGDWCFRSLATRDALLVGEGRKLREFLDSLASESKSAAKPKECYESTSHEPMRVTAVPTEGQTRGNSITHRTQTDAWGFRIGTRNSFLMQKLEQGGMTKDEIRLEFVHHFHGSAGKSTFKVFFTDVIRPFGCASVSRCVRITSDEGGRLGLDVECARMAKAAVAEGILTEINSLEGTFPKKNQQAIDAIVHKYKAPRR